MSVTLNDLITLVNNEVGNIPERGNATATGDATTVDYLIAPAQRFIVEDDPLSEEDETFAFYIDGVGDSTGTMNYDNGVYTLYQPEDGHTLYWEFNYVYWPDTMVETAITAAIDMLFPFYYKHVVEELVAGNVSNEYPVTTPYADVVSEVRSDGVRIPARKWTLDKNGEDATIRFFTAPSGVVKARVVQRPALIDSNLNVPDRAAAPIVSYAAYYLLSQKVAPRMRADVAMATIGGGNLSPRQMNDASNSFYLRYQMQVQSGRMHPWSVL